MNSRRSLWIWRSKPTVRALASTLPAIIFGGKGRVMPLIAMPGLTELLVIFGVILLLFGAKKLPQLGGAIGESIKNFKRGIGDDSKELPDETPGDKPKEKTESEHKG